MDLDVSHNLDSFLVLDVIWERAVHDEAQGESVNLVIDVHGLLVELRNHTQSSEESRLPVLTLDKTIFEDQLSDLDGELLKREDLNTLSLLLDGGLLWRCRRLPLDGLDEHLLLLLRVAKCTLLFLTGLLGLPGFLAAEAQAVGNLTKSLACSDGDQVLIGDLVLELTGRLLGFGHFE